MLKIDGLRILIIGASGFIGSHLVRTLTKYQAIVTAGVKPGSDSWRLKAINDHFQWLACDLLEPDTLLTTLQLARPEIIFHCASSHWNPTSILDRQSEFRVSTLGAFHLAEALRAYPPRLLINISTLQERQPCHGIHYNDGNFDPITFRGAAKAAGTLLLHQAGMDSGFKVSTLRFSSIFGPWQPPERLIPKAIRSALTKTALPLVQSTAVRDFLYIDDAISSCLLALVDEATGVILAVGSGILTPIRTVVEEIYQLCGVSCTTFPAFPQRTHDFAFGAADIALTKTLLNWEPRFPLHTGLAQTIQWQRDYEFKNSSPTTSDQRSDTGL